MRKNQIIISVLILAVLIMSGVIVQVFLQEEGKKEEQRPIISEDAIPAGAEENFYLYLKLPSVSGKFVKFDEVKSEINIIYFNTETMKIVSQNFKIDTETIFSKISFEPDKPNIFSRKDFKNVEQEIWATVFYLSSEKENEIPLARLIKVEASF